jgi:hypothetical protein
MNMTIEEAMSIASSGWVLLGKVLKARGVW